MSQRPRFSDVIISLAGCVVLIAGLRAAQPVLLPFICAVLVSVIAAPALFWMKRKGVPDWLAISIELVVLVFLILMLGAVLGRSFNQFSQALPDYQKKLQSGVSASVNWLSAQGVSLSDQEIQDYFDPGAAMRFAASTFREVSSLLGNAFLLVLTVVFMLFEASSFPRKLNEAFIANSMSPGLSQFSESVKQYFLIKTGLSLLTGVLVWLLLLAMGVDFAVLWALMAFLLNYVPNIGSIIAAVPAVLLAAVQHGIFLAFGVAVGYTAVNLVIGNLVEPRLMGRGLGLSTLVVFLSLVFWGWLWGPLGMLLSVPLTIIVKIALESFDDTRWIAVLLSD